MKSYKIIYSEISLASNEQVSNSTNAISTIVTNESVKKNKNNAKVENDTLKELSEDDSSSENSSGFEIEISDNFLQACKLENENSSDEENDYKNNINITNFDNNKNSSNSILKYLKNKSSTSVNVINDGKECYMEF